jgi:hypothetical protein
MKRLVFVVPITLVFLAYNIEASEQTSISSSGVIESKSGGFKFPDGSVQQTAAPTTLSQAGMFCDYPYVVIGFTEDGNCFCSNEKECRQPGACPNLETGSLCATSTTLPGISGDTGSDLTSLSGHGDAWFEVHVSEDDASLELAALTFQASLSVPAGTDYDLEILCDACDNFDAALVSDNPDSETEILTVGWEDTLGTDESRDIFIHVKFFSSPDCLEVDWTLDISGNVGTPARNCPMP